jgi:putative oxidoreductase
MNNKIVLYHQHQQRLAAWLKHLDGLPSLALRLYLAPIFWMAGSHKIDLSTWLPFESTVNWFGNSQWGLGLPYPEAMAFLAGWTEILGAIFLTVGILVRWISIPLIITMAVAAVTAHWDNGWQAIADASAPFANERVMESVPRLAAAKDILREYGNYGWLTGRGSMVILNNGIEFAASYLIMLLALLALGGGRYVSLDYWLNHFLGAGTGTRDAVGRWGS